MAVAHEANASAVARDLAAQLHAWAPASPGQAALRDEYRVRLGDPTALDREASRSHFTASCFVFTESFSAILLCFHNKGQFWVQPGGHIETTDSSVAAAGFREALEETGVAVSPLSEKPLDVDKQFLNAGFVRCDVHWDVGFASVADEQESPVTNNESADVRWWPVRALPQQVPEGFASRVERIVDAATALS